MYAVIRTGGKQSRVEQGQRLDVELLGKAVLDVVDQGQLGGPLVGLGQEPLCLVEQADVLEGDTQARSQGGQDTFIRIAERIGVVEVLEGDVTAYLRTNDQRDEQHGLRGLTRRDNLLHPALRGPGIDVPDAHRSATRQDRARHRADRNGLVGEADASLETVNVRDRS